MGRALAWLLLGLLVLVLVIVASAPELVGADPGGATGLLALALAAGLPGLVAVVVLAVRRRGPRTPDER